jgi:hypothetical protein
MGKAAREKFLREFTLPRHIERIRLAFLDVAGATPTVEEAASREELAPAANVPAASAGY